MKYNVGDRVRIKSLDWYNENKNNRNEITFENNPHWRFVANQSDYCGQIATITSVSKTAYRLESIPWNWTDEMIEGLAEEETKNSNDMEEKETLLGWVKESDSLRLVPHKDYEIKHDGDNFYLVKKKKEYPKTYEECLKVLNIEGGRLCFNNSGITQYERDLYIMMNNLSKLLICRDAYWKIAGEKMGLGKPWELSIGIPIYYIYYNRTLGTIKKDYADDIQGNVILAFPTAEMRDAFYENFKELIESCKELL